MSQERITAREVDNARAAELRRRGFDDEPAYTPDVRTAGELRVDAMLLRMYNEVEK